MGSGARDYHYTPGNQKRAKYYEKKKKKKKKEKKKKRKRRRRSRRRSRGNQLRPISLIAESYRDTLRALGTDTFSFPFMSYI